jgi:hypothetical protein
MKVFGLVVPPIIACWVRATSGWAKTTPPTSVPEVLTVYDLVHLHELDTRKRQLRKVNGPGGRPQFRPWRETMVPCSGRPQRSVLLADDEPPAHENDFTLAIGALAHDGRQMPGNIADS